MADLTADSQKVCQHEGKGSYCHKCGQKFQEGAFPGSRQCDQGSHRHMKENLKREYCTYCGEKL